MDTTELEARVQAMEKLWHGLVEAFLYEGYSEVDSETFMELAVNAGLLRWDTYDPVRDKDIDFEYDEPEPGDRIWRYTELGASMTTAWLSKLVGADGG